MSLWCVVFCSYQIKRELVVMEKVIVKKKVIINGAPRCKLCGDFQTEYIISDELEKSQPLYSVECNTCTS